MSSALDMALDSMAYSHKQVNGSNTSNTMDLFAQPMLREDVLNKHSASFMGNYIVRLNNNYYYLDNNYNNTNNNVLVII